MRERSLGCNAIRAESLARAAKIAEKTIHRKRIALTADGADKAEHHGAMTGDIINAANGFNIAVHDHIINGKNGFSSMRSARLI